MDGANRNSGPDTVWSGSLKIESRSTTDSRLVPLRSGARFSTLARNDCRETLVLLRGENSGRQKVGGDCVPDGRWASSRAGDIASCDGDETAVELLDGIEGTIVTLGDNACARDMEGQPEGCYGSARGHHKDRTNPISGNHDYKTLGADDYFDHWGEPVTRTKTSLGAEPTDVSVQTELMEKPASGSGNRYRCST